MSGAEQGALSLAALRLDGAGLAAEPAGAAFWIGRPPPALSGVTADSRAAGPGMLFAALPGVNAHGAAYAPAAMAAGAAAVLTDTEGAVRLSAGRFGAGRFGVGRFGARVLSPGEAGVPVLVDSAPRRRLARLAAHFAGPPPARLVAATGTNGKTSTAHFARQLWAAMGETAASLGTTGADIERPGAGPEDAGLGASLTTPEPVTLHRLLAALAAQGAQRAALEASSHGLAQARLDGTRLAAGAFLNLSRDHLDYHPTPEAYAAAKLRLFSDVLPEGAAAVIGADDALAPVAAALAEARGRRVMLFGRAASGPNALALEACDAAIAGLEIRVRRHGPDGAPAGPARRLSLRLVGGFQALNALAAAGLVIGADPERDPDAVLAALEQLTAVRGRMELVARRANGAGVYVDYSHTPDAVRAALAALRLHTPGRLHVVVGAGGDRDPGKRPLMGACAAEGADRVLVTDDNPRSEDPAAIRAAVLAGAPGASDGGERAEAILRGVDGLGPGDALLIAGKGHETGQEIAGVTHPFDDAEQARAAVYALDGEEGALTP